MSKEININQPEYGEILQQAVAEIHAARSLVAKQLAKATNSAYWNLGKLLFEKQEADYAKEVFKDTCNLGFLGITEKVKEMELEKRLVEKIKSFVLELGRGFSFISCDCPKTNYKLY